MQYRYRTVMADGAVIGLATEREGRAGNIYAHDYFYGDLRSRDLLDEATLDGLTTSDYPLQVLSVHPALTFGPVLLTDELPDGLDMASKMEFYSWFRARVNDLAGM